MAAKSKKGAQKARQLQQELEAIAAAAAVEVVVEAAAPVVAESVPAVVARAGQFRSVKDFVAANVAAKKASVE